MNKKFFMKTMKLARFMLLPTLMVITGLKYVKQELPSVQIAQYSVLNNFQLASGLHQSKKVQKMPKKVRKMPKKDQIKPNDMCNSPTCQKNVD